MKFYLSCHNTKLIDDIVNLIGGKTKPADVLDIINYQYTIAKNDIFNVSFSRKDSSRPFFDAPLTMTFAFNKNEFTEIYQFDENGWNDWNCVQIEKEDVDTKRYSHVIVFTDLDNDYNNVEMYSIEKFFKAIEDVFVENNHVYYKLIANPKVEAGIQFNKK